MICVTSIRLAWDTTVLYTPLNPGIPVLVIGAVVISHFGAVLTVLPDSSLLVLRTIDNHPLGLQPGDIVLGYEGVPWKDLVDELLESGIPILSCPRGAKSASEIHELVSAGMNWHLFETIDIVKYASGDTVHLPVYPLANLPVPPTEAEFWSKERTSCGIMSNCLFRVFLFLTLMNLIKDLLPMVLLKEQILVIFIYMLKY